MFSGANEEESLDRFASDLADIFQKMLTIELVGPTGGKELLAKCA